MKLWIAATLAAFLLAACNAKAYLPYHVEEGLEDLPVNNYPNYGMDDRFANAEQDMTPDFDDGADIEQMDYPSDYPVTTPDANVEFEEIMEPETGDVQRRIKSCLNNFYILAFTSGYKHGGSDKSHKVRVTAAGQTRSVVLPNLPKDDYERYKGDLWKLTFSGNFKFTGCITRKSIRSVAIVAANNDGWNIDSIVTYVGAHGHDLTELTRDFDVCRWIDGNGKPSHKHFYLTKV